MKNELINKIKRIDVDKAVLDAARPLPTYTLKSLREKYALEWTYHSNGIEGNTLTLRETKVVLEGITIGGKSVREHLEAINHAEAIAYLDSLVSGNELFSQWHIRNIHHLVLKSVDDKNAGNYRKEPVTIAGASTTPPAPILLNDEMNGLDKWYAESGDLHPIERASQLHTRFVKIHPFVDGNGRTARLIMNLELMKAGYPPAIIRVEDRSRYYDVLDHACVTGDFDGITELVAEAEERTLHGYLDLLGLKGDHSQSDAPNDTHPEI
jgi:Fic family protein